MKRTLLSLLKNVLKIWRTRNLAVEGKITISKVNISLNSQFTVALSSMICFSVRFCDTSLLMLIRRFRVFSFASKKVQGFSSDRKTLMLF